MNNKKTDNNAVYGPEILPLEARTSGTVRDQRVEPKMMSETLS
jgi:hypothetical protein